MVASLIYLSLLAAGAAVAQVHELDGLRLEQALAMQAESSLVQERARLLQLGAGVSEQIDSLKVTGELSEALTEASLRAMELNNELARVNLQLEVLAERHDSLKVQLRAAYDWEIARLLGLLGEGWDEGLWEQLAIYQEERQGLGFDLVAAEMRYGPDMEVAPDDGPEEIEQKADLMRDKLNMVRHDLARIDRRVGYLSGQVEVVTSLFGQFGAGTRGGAAGHNVRAARLGVEAEARSVEIDSAPESPARRGHQVPVRPEVATRSASPLSPGDAGDSPAIRGLRLEILRLKARRQEIRQIEAVYANRLDVFERRRAGLLEGRE